MYKELGTFVSHIVRQKAIWKDGELWTAVVGGFAGGVVFYSSPAVMDSIKGHFSDSLTITSIVFGFVLSTLTFYISAASNWKQEDRVAKVAQKLVDWHVWTVLCMLLLIGYTVALWAVDRMDTQVLGLRGLTYAVLVFINLYVACQILNHTLTLWWVYNKRSTLEREHKSDLP